MVANVNWIGFKELFIKTFMLKYQKLVEGMNLVQIRHIGSLKAYVHNFNTQMNAMPKIDEFANKYIFLDGFQN